MSVHLSFNTGSVIHREFLSLYKIPVLPKECIIVLGAVTSGIKTLLSSATRSPPSITLQLSLTDLYIGNFDPILNNKTCNKLTKELIQRDTISFSFSFFLEQLLF